MLRSVTITVRNAVQRAPLVLPVLMAMSAVLMVEYPGRGSLLCVAAVSMILWLQGIRAGIISLFLAALFGFLHYEQVSRQKTYEKTWEQEPLIEFNGSVLRQNGTRAIVEGKPALGTGGKTTIEVYLRHETETQLGNSYSFLLQKRNTVGELNPGEFDRQNWLYRQGISGTFNALSSGNPKKGSLKSRILKTSCKLNQTLGARIDAGIPRDDPRGQVLKSLVLGARSQAAPEVVDPFRMSGLLHIFAVSGLHVGLVALLITPFLFFLGLRPGVFALLLAVLLVLYDFATGLSISANRATFMMVVFLGGWSARRQNSPFNRLALAAMILVACDTHALFQMGFQLSFVIFATVVIAGNSIKAIHGFLGPDPYIPESLYTSKERLHRRLSRTFTGWLIISFAAWLIASLFLIPNIHYASPYAPLANTVLTLPVTVLMAGGLLCLIFGGIPFFGEFIFAMTKSLSGLVLATAQFFTDLPASCVSLSPDPPPDSLTIYSLPGDAYAAVMGNPAVLIESGSESSARYIVIPSLLKQGYRPKLIAISHFHKQQAEGLSLISRRWPQAKLITPHPAGTVSKKYFEGIDSQKIKNPYRGQFWRNKSGGMLTVLDSPGDNDRAVGGEDESCLIFLWEYQGIRVLFLGDGGYNAEQRLRQNYPGLTVDYVLIGKHRNDLSYSRDFLDSLSAKKILSPPIYPMTISLKQKSTNDN